MRTIGQRWHQQLVMMIDDLSLGDDGEEDTDEAVEGNTHAGME
jgi:hypothetical protein